MNQNKHLFAIYLKNLSGLFVNLQKDQNVKILDKDFYQRITKILRLKPFDHISIFDNDINIEVIIDPRTFEQKKNIFCKIIRINKNKKLMPEIIFCPAILKRNSFQDIFYIASQMGVNQITPILTDKIQRKWGDHRELEKLNKIMISAAEQSKNFIIPKIQNSILLDSFLHDLNKSKNRNVKKIVFEVGGKKLFDLLSELQKDKFDKIFVMFGPEGGFTEAEIKLLKENEFEVYALTPTILRSVEAVAVGLGSIRSIV